MFNNQDGGFIIVGGDEAADDVLGYAFNGSFDSRQLPPNFRWWLSTYEQSISKSIRARRADNRMMARAPRKASSLPTVPTLLTTQWNQDMPYNAMIPGNTSTTPWDYQYATGCVATAVAQIMTYHKWPEHGWSSNKYQKNGYTYEADFGNTTYNWELLQDHYDEPYTGTAAEQEVAKLMYHIGVAVNMDYGMMQDGGSGASTYTASQRLETHFGYKSGQFIQRNLLSDADWENYVYSELSSRRPVLYSGTSEDGGGHAFVCDGFENGKFHINWGWGGYCDGMYNLTPTASEDALDPNGSGIGGAGEGETYKSLQSIVVGLEPNTSYDGCLRVSDVIMPYCDNYYVSDEPFEIEYVLENSSSVPRTISDPTLYIYSGNGSEYFGYLDGYPGFEVEPHTTRSLKITSEGAIPDWMTKEHDLILLLTDYTDNYRYLQHNITVSKALNIDYTLTDAGWGTICLPYDAEIPEGITAYNITGVSQDGNLIKTTADKFEMNKAYLIQGEPDLYQFHGPATPEGIYQNGLLVGVTTQTGEFAPQDTYVLQKQPSEGLGFYLVDSPDTFRIRQYTAYLATPSPQHARFLLDGESGIHTVSDELTEAIATFNVMGQRTETATGLVIMNGKLNFVK